MPVLLWLSLILGYTVGIAAAFFLLPKPMLEPFTGRIVLASTAVLAGALIYFLLRREQPAAPDGERPAGEPAGQVGAGVGKARTENGRAAGGAPPFDPGAGAPPFDDDGCDDLIGDPAKLEILGRRLDDPLARGSDGSLSPRELRQILYDGRVDGLIRPSLALPEGREAFQHVIPRLRDLAGGPLEPHTYARTAARCGLTGLIDRVFVIRTLQRITVERRSGERRTACCNIDASSLIAPVFTDGILEFLDDHLELRGHLVLEFERLPGERPARAAMQRLRERGARFCLKRLSAAPIDPERIRTAGFDFIRLAAPRYALLPAVADLLPQLAALQAAADRAGLQIVVDRADAGRTVHAGHDLPFDPPRFADELQENAA